MFIVKKKYSSYGLMEFSTGLQDEYYYGFHPSDHTHADTHTHEMRSETERQRGRSRDSDRKKKCYFLKRL